MSHSYVFYDPTVMGGDIGSITNGTDINIETEIETVRSPQTAEIDQLRTEVKELRERVQKIETILSNAMAQSQKGSGGYWEET